MSEDKENPTACEHPNVGELDEQTFCKDCGETIGATTGGMQ